MAAKKKFGDLLPGDKLYLIDPNDATTVREATVKEVIKNTPSDGLCKVIYFRVAEELAKKLETQDMVPTDTLITRMDLASIIGAKNINGLPIPIPYFTNREHLIEWAMDTKTLVSRP
jgi:hypothetical protein